jgi:multidrug efflux pump subunit AcrB
MNLFANNFEFFAFILLAIPFVWVVAVTLTMLYSDRYMRANADLAIRLFNGKNKKYGRMVLFAILAGVANYYNWLMMETLLIAIIAWHVGMAFFFRNTGITANLVISHR